MRTTKILNISLQHFLSRFINYNDLSGARLVKIIFLNAVQLFSSFFIQNNRNVVSKNNEFNCTCNAEFHFSRRDNEYVLLRIIAQVFEPSVIIIVVLVL